MIRELRLLLLVNCRQQAITQNFDFFRFSSHLKRFPKLDNINAPTIAPSQRKHANRRCVLRVD
jgi:hypothetical protein